MEFLDKLYESNYFGIGLFAVISFLVVTFLIVLFFGKKDEKKRKLEETQNIKAENTFKETSTGIPVDVPVQTPVAPIQTPVEPVVAPVEPIPVNEPVTPIVMPINPIEGTQTVPEVPIQKVEPIKPVEPVSVSPINYANEPIKPVAPIQYEIPNDQNFVDNLRVEEPKVEVTPIINETTGPKIANMSEPVISNTVEPIRIEPTRYEIPNEPVKMEPIKITIPEEPIKPVIKEEETPITPIIEEPTIEQTYYNPTPKVEPEEIKVPNIDFDAIAKSISQELDELEKSSSQVKVTPMNEIQSNYSSPSMIEPQVTPVKPVMDMPKKIDLPTMKSDEIEGESYHI